MSEVKKEIDKQNVERAANHISCLKTRFELVSALGFIVSQPDESRDLFGDTNFEKIVDIFQKTYIDD